MFWSITGLRVFVLITYDCSVKSKKVIPPVFRPSEFFHSHVLENKKKLISDNRGSLDKESAVSFNLMGNPALIISQQIARESM